MKLYNIYIYIPSVSKIPLSSKQSLVLFLHVQSKSDLRVVLQSWKADYQINMLLWSHKIYGGYITEVESKNQMQLFSLWEFFSQYHANSDNFKKIVTSIWAHISTDDYFSIKS